MGELTDEVRSFLGGRRYAVLATSDPDGGIRLTPIWFLFEDDRFYFASSSESRPVKNVERNLAASVVVDAREPGRERWVSASGPGEILRDGEAQSINTRIWRRYLAPRAHNADRSRAPRVGRHHAPADADGVAVVDRADRGLAGAVVPGGRRLEPRRGGGRAARSSSMRKELSAARGCCPCSALGEPTVRVEGQELREVVGEDEVVEEGGGIGPGVVGER
jgi:general stress protein 26